MGWNGDQCRRPCRISSNNVIKNLTAAYELILRAG